MRELFGRLIHSNILDFVFLLLILIMIFFLILIGRRYKSRAGKGLRQRSFVKMAEIGQIENEDRFKEIVINSVRKAGFANHEELFRNIKEDIVFRAEGTKGKKFIIVALYWPHDIRIYIPLEEVKKYFEQIQSSGVPHLIATNSLGLKQKAQDLLDKFNKKFGEPKLFFISGSSEAEFIQRFKNIDGR